MNIQKLTLGLYQTNIYILSNDTEAVVIDPGYEADTILAALAGKTLKAILLTHGHFDHVGAVKDLAADTDCRVFLCADETVLPPMFTAGPLYYTDAYGEGSILNIADILDFANTVELDAVKPLLDSQIEMNTAIATCVERSFRQAANSAITAVRK